MNQQSLSLSVDYTFLTRVFAMHLQPFFAAPVDDVALREMTAALVEANIDPLFAYNFSVTQNEECNREGFEVAVSYLEGGTNQQGLIYITEHDMALGQVTDLEELKVAIELHGKYLMHLMDKARSCAASPRDVAMAHSHFEDAFFRLRQSTEQGNGGGY